MPQAAADNTEAGKTAADQTGDQTGQQTGQQTGDQTGQQTGQQTGDQTGQQQQSKAPESYTDFQFPEGVSLNDTIMGEFKTLAKESNLSQESAQKLVSLGAKMAQGFADTSDKAITELKASFETELKADKEIGGDGLNANVALAEKAIDHYGTPKLKEMLTASGLNRHPELVRFFSKIGKLVDEDNTGAGGTGQSGGESTLAERMYGSSAAA